MDDGTGDDLAKRRADANRRADGSEREIETSRTLREISNHEDGDNAEYARRNPVQNLNCHQRNGMV